MSPSGAVSKLLVPSTWTCDQCGLAARDGPFRLGSSRHLGEDPQGQWRLRIADRVRGGSTARLESWHLTVYGHRSTPGPPTITSVDGGSAPLTVAWEAPGTAGRSAVTGYDVRYAPSGDADPDDDSAWTLASDVWASGSLSHAISGLETGVEYHVQVRAVNDAGAGAWSRPKAAQLGAAASAPRFPSTEDGMRSVDENTPAGVDVGDPLEAEDPDGAGLTYSLSGPGAGSFEIVETTGQLRTRAPLDHEPHPSHTFTVIATDPSGLADEIAVTVAVKDVNEPPELSGDAAWRIAEGHRRPSAFGLWYYASDPEGDPVRWSLSGPDHAHFVVDDTAPYPFFLLSSTEAAEMSFGIRPDFERPRDEDGDNVYEMRLEASDGVESTSMIVKATVRNVDEAPKLTGDTTIVYEENHDGSVATFSAVDPEGDPVRWSLSGTLKGSDQGAFSIDGGVLSFRQPPDFESPADGGADNVYNLTVWAWDGPQGSLLPVEVTVSNVDEDGSLVLSSVEPQVGAEMDAALSDPDGGLAAVTWRWERSADRTSWGVIAGASSESYTPTANDRGRYLRVTASYIDAHSTRKTLRAQTGTVRAQPASNRAPQFPPSETGRRSVAEDAAPGTSFGARVEAADPDRDGLTYSLSGPGAGAFEIVETTGQMRTRVALDYEAARSYSVTVSVHDGKDADGNADTTVDDTVDVEVAVTDVDEPPTLTVDAAVDCEESDVSETLLLAGLVDAEDVAVDCEENDDAVVAVFSADDPEQRAVTYSPLEGDDSDRFRIGDGGSLRFRSPPDFEARADSDGHNDYQVTVRASDGPNSVTRDVVVTVTDVNEPPTLSGDTVVSIHEHAPLVRFYTADDPEVQTVAYSLGGVDAGDFDVSGLGLLTFRGGFPDYEDPKDSDLDNVYLVEVRVSDRRDADGNADDAIDDTVAVTVTVVDVNEHPTLSGPDAVDYEENGSDAVASYAAADPEQVEVAWSLEGADRGVFAISGIGEVSFDSSVGRPDFEDPADSDGNNRYQIRVVASDGTNPVGRDLAVTVTNADEEGSVTLSSQQPQVGTALRASVSDPDGSVSAVSWLWEASSSPSDPNSWSGTGGTGAAYTPDAGDEGDHLRVTATYRDAQGSGKSASAPAAEAVRAAPVAPNSPPEFPTSETGRRGVPENTGPEVDLGDPVSALDDDADDVLTYSLGGADGGSFEVVAATGQLLTKAPLDRESKSLYSVEVTATDASGESATIAVAITVTNVDERPALSGPEAVNHKENDGAVTSYEAEDPEGGTIAWTLAGDDAAAFTIGGGRLRFRSRPDFEAPHDADTDNEYRVVVTASDGSPDSEDSGIGVAVTVIASMRGSW